MSLQETALFVGMGLLGGIAHMFVDSETWQDLTKFDAVKRVILGGIVGLVYHFGYSVYNLPNGMMAFVSGYAGTDFIIRLVEKLGEEKPVKPPS